MRYRDATRRPGRNRPSFSKYSAELEGRDEDADFGRGGNGEVAVAKSSVATSSVFEVARPQAEQKRTLFSNSAPQLEHLAMKISRYSLTQTLDIGPQTSAFSRGRKVAPPSPVAVRRARCRR
jgi:hypothetical protein